MGQIQPLAADFEMPDIHLTRPPPPIKWIKPPQGVQDTMVSVVMPKKLFDKMCYTVDQRLKEIRDNAIVDYTWGSTDVDNKKYWLHSVTKNAVKFRELLNHVSWLNNEHVRSTSWDVEQLVRFMDERYS